MPPIASTNDHKQARVRPKRRAVDRSKLLSMTQQQMKEANDITKQDRDQFGLPFGASVREE